MEGIEVNLDTNIGKWLSKLADTVTRLAETQNITSQVSRLVDKLLYFWTKFDSEFKNANMNDQEMELKKLKKDLVYFM